MVRHAWRSIRNRSLLQKFGLTALVAIALIGVVLGQLLRTSVERQVLDGAIGEAEVVSRLGLQNAIGPSELKAGLTSQRVRSLELLLRSDFARIDVVDVVLWNLDRTVVFATDTSDIGTVTTESIEVQRAASGEALAKVVDLRADDDADPLLRRHGRVVQVYQPVRFGSSITAETSGVLRTSIPYDPIAATIAAETRRLYLALALACLALYAMLFRLVANASSELQRRADENEQQARHDALTGLPNRTLFAEELNQILDRHGPHPLAIALIDLDRFKDVNDTLGHHTGDLLLIEVGRRLQETLRAHDLVARLGGDEFALVLTGMVDAEAALAVAGRVVEVIEEPFEIEGLQLDVGASIGVAMAPEHGTDLATLLQRADIAMYLAKRTGVGSALYDPTHDHHSRQQLALTGDLRRRMDDELVVHYQPKLDLASDRVCGVEALVRWDHPELGLLPPGDFVPLAERSGMMNRLTSIVLEQSLAQLGRWLADGRDLHLAVNVSARGLHDVALTDVIESGLVRHGVPAERLVLEVTETTIAADPDGARQVLGRLRAQGVRFSIDDFGTGYSSLAVLRSLPVNEIKIDREFVGDLSHPEGSAIVEYSIRLGHMLGLTVVAEGVEDDGAPPRLRELGCDLGQGFWFAPPMAADELTTWLDAGPSRRGRRIIPIGNNGLDR
ncbi:MAG: EAL domain-containing protein [Actinomycetota bacterium]